MIEGAVRACPDSLWSDRTREPEFWYIVFHTLFWLDFYLTASPGRFAPPPPFSSTELDPAGILPERPYTREEMLGYLEHGRTQCRRTIAALTAEEAGRQFTFGSVELPVGELLLYTLRHVQHHAGQLNLMLRQQTGSAPRWVKYSGEPLSGLRGS